MRVLRKGMVGDDVTGWQNFLRGLLPDSLVIVNGTFDDVTHNETVRFQKMSGLWADGVVGPNTAGSALKLGYHAMTDDSVDETGPNWPTKPDGVSSLSGVDREKLFGKFSYVPAPSQWNPEGIKITDNWAANNISTVVVPQLMIVNGGPRDGKVSFHSKGAKQLQDLFAEWESAGLMNRVMTWGGSWVPRFVRGSRTYLSNHSWGTAFDINAQWNGLGARPALKGLKGSVRELVEIADKHGFFWGGWWADRPDGMHFELRTILP